MGLKSLFSKLSNSSKVLYSSTEWTDAWIYSSQSFLNLYQHHLFLAFRSLILFTVQILLFSAWPGRPSSLLLCSVCFHVPPGVEPTGHSQTTEDRVLELLSSLSACQRICHLAPRPVSRGWCGPALTFYLVSNSDLLIFPPTQPLPLWDSHSLFGCFISEAAVALLRQLTFFWWHHATCHLQHGRHAPAETQRCLWETSGLLLPARSGCKWDLKAFWQTSGIEEVRMKPL